MKLSTKKWLLLSCYVLAILSSIKLNAQVTLYNQGTGIQADYGPSSQVFTDRNRTLYAADDFEVPGKWYWDYNSIGYGNKYYLKDPTSFTGGSVPTNWAVSTGIADYDVGQQLVFILTGGSTNTPTFTSAAVTTVDDNATYSYTVTTSDLDNDQVTVSATVKPDWLSMNAVTTVSTFAGSGNAGSVDGTGAAASFDQPVFMVVDGSDNIYVSTYSHRIRKITPAGEVSTFAGSGDYGSVNGTGVAASFANPSGMAIDASGNLFVADFGNHTIRKITPAGVVTTFAGMNGVRGSVNATGTNASFSGPVGMTIDASDNLYVTELVNNRIRKITPAGEVTTFAGSGSSTPVDGTGVAAGFNGPDAIDIDDSGNLYVTEQNSHLVRKITPAGVVTTIAGTGNTGSSDGTGTNASFNTPYNVLVDGSNNLLVAEYGNHTIRKITPSGEVTTIAGLALNSGLVNGAGADARFNSPIGLAMNSDGEVYVAELGNHIIRKINFGYQLSGDATGQFGDHNVTLSASDGNGGTATQAFTITVNDVTAPTGYSVEIDQVHINASNESSISFTFSEAEVGSTYNYSFTDTGGATPVTGTGTITSANQKVSGINLSTLGQGNITLSATLKDGGNNTGASVTNTKNRDTSEPFFENSTPSSSNITGTSFDLTLDISEAGKVYYVIVPNEATLPIYLDIRAGNANGGGTPITSGSNTVSSEAFTHTFNITGLSESTSYDVYVLPEDLSGNYPDVAVKIDVTTIDETDPVLTSATIANFAENETGTAYTVTATDANTLTYSLGSGNGEALFDIVSGTGVVTFKTSPDFENPTDGDDNNTYIINVIASDGVNSVNQNVTITVTNVDDTDPVLTSATTTNFAENGTGTAYTVTATDANTLTYSLGSGNDEALFDIVSGTGVVTFKTSPDFENPTDGDDNNTYIINVIASDGVNSVNQNVTITGIDVNEAPSFDLIPEPNQVVISNSEEQTVSAFAISITDGDDQATQTLTFDVSNNNNTLFAVQPSIDVTTGDLTYTLKGNEVGSATVTVSLSDDGGTENGGINISEVRTFTIEVDVATGIDKGILTDRNIVTYPIPARDMLNIDVSNLSDNEVVITIINLSGQKNSFPKLISGDLITIDVSNYEAGVYLLKVKSNQGEFSKKIILGQ